MFRFNNNSSEQHIKILHTNYTNYDRIKRQLELIKKDLSNPLAVVCIGTPKLLVDSIGPEIGSMLKLNASGFIVLGTSKAPLESNNIDAIHSYIAGKSVIAIDATKGNWRYKKGTVIINKGLLYPGMALGKQLKPLGDYYIKIITEGGFPHSTINKEEAVKISNLMSNIILEVFK